MKCYIMRHLQVWELFVFNYNYIKLYLDYHQYFLDEQALLKGSQLFGYVFHTRTPKSVSVSELGKNGEYEILNVIEFTSARKRMSVIVRTPENKIHLYCKVSI